MFEVLNLTLTNMRHVRARTKVARKLVCLADSNNDRTFFEGHSDMFVIDPKMRNYRRTLNITEVLPKSKLLYCTTYDHTHIDTYTNTHSAKQTHVYVV